MGLQGGCQTGVWMGHGARQGAQGVVLTCVSEAMEGRQGSGARPWQERPRRRKGGESPSPAGAGGRCTQTSPHKTLPALLWNKAPQYQWLTPTGTYLSPDPFGWAPASPWPWQLQLSSLPLGVLEASLGLLG